MKEVIVLCTSRLGRSAMLAALAAQLAQQGHTVVAEDEAAARGGFGAELKRVTDQLRGEMSRRDPDLCEPAYYEPKRKAQWKSEVPRHRRGR